MGGTATWSQLCNTDTKFVVVPRKPAVTQIVQQCFVLVKLLILIVSNGKGCLNWFRLACALRVPFRRRALKRQAKRQQQTPKLRVQSWNGRSLSASTQWKTQARKLKRKVCCPSLDWPIGYNSADQLLIFAANNALQLMDDKVKADLQAQADAFDAKVASLEDNSKVGGRCGLGNCRVHWH